MWFRHYIITCCPNVCCSRERSGGVGGQMNGRMDGQTDGWVVASRRRARDRCIDYCDWCWMTSLKKIDQWRETFLHTFRGKYLCSILYVVSQLVVVVCQVCSVCVQYSFRFTSRHYSAVLDWHFVIHFCSTHRRLKFARDFVCGLRSAPFPRPTVPAGILLTDKTADYGSADNDNAPSKVR